MIIMMMMMIIIIVMIIMMMMIMMMMMMMMMMIMMMMIIMIIIIAFKSAFRDAQVARAQSCANHVQHVVLRATWFNSHLFELYFIG